MKNGSKILGIILIIIVTFSLGTVGGYYLFKMKMDNSNTSSVEGDKKNNPDEKDNVSYKVWLEDSSSMEERLKLVTGNSLAGAAFWKLGFETSSIWDTVIKYIN